MKKLFLVLGLVLMLGFSSAHDVSYKEKFTETKYFIGEPVVVSRSVSVNYDNDDRYSTYDYRHGYSYRATRDYFERKHDVDELRVEIVHKYNYRDRHERHYMDYRRYDKYDWDYYSPRKSVRYDYVPHLRVIEGQECYTRAPADKLFYVKC